MGGAAYIIYGEYKAEDEKNGIINLFFRKKSKKEQTEDMICNELKINFIEFLEDIVKSNSSQVIKNYIREKGIIKCKIEKKEKDYISIYFSGCAGMTQVSANVASHWADYWYTNKKEIIGEILKKYNFKISGVTENVSDKNIFVPAEDAGYAELIIEEGQEKEYLDSFIFETAIFETDEAYLETSDEKEFLKLNRELNQKYGKILKNRKCLCEVCEKEKGCENNV